MNHYLKKATITGLWGMNTEFSIPLDRKFNFLIGRNGTGKTTVINLIAAVLTGDFERLDKIQFSRVFISLASADSRKRPSIEVVKIQKPNLPYFDISYRIKTSASAEASIYDLDALEEERMYRGAPPRMLRERVFREKFLYIQRQLENLVGVSWLSVHRQTEVDKVGNDERRSPMSAIDAKLQNMTNLLVRYFSRLASGFSEETKAFQKASFLSLTSPQKESNVRSFVRSIDIEAERKALTSVFEVLGVEQKQFERQLDQLGKELLAARKPFLEHAPITLQHLSAVFNSYRAHMLVQLYEGLQAKRKTIFEPTDKFLKVVNSLITPRKEASISLQNELIVKNGAGIKIEMEDLSSGEKQLLIILGQALLQESAPVVYIADEPELSLHVEWQEKLTLAISEINPNAQIVFATHSPDIVGPHQDKIIDMEAIAQ
jgi:energy-coupling factor transporter ATP-binding protein EcfA2